MSVSSMPLRSTSMSTPRTMGSSQLAASLSPGLSEGEETGW